MRSASARAQSGNASQETTRTRCAASTSWVHAETRLAGQATTPSRCVVVALLSLRQTSGSPTSSGPLFCAEPALLSCLTKTSHAATRFVPSCHPLGTSTWHAATVAMIGIDHAASTCTSFEVSPEKRVAFRCPGRDIICAKRKPPHRRGGEFSS